jgi:osmotically-inducible protein OsmY
VRNLKNLVSDIDLRDAVEVELEWDPRVDDSRIRVTAKDGAIALRGSVDSYPQKWAAVRAAERIRGVKAVADDIRVRLPDAVIREDAEIAQEIAHQRSWNTSFPDPVDVEVTNGKVTLRGDVPWSYQRDEAVRAVRHLEGVRSVSNLIRVKPQEEAEVSDVERRIEEAIWRQADLDADSITVATSNGVVRLEGSVGSLAERRLAQLAAESAPGVTKVENEISVTF